MIPCNVNLLLEPAGRGTNYQRSQRALLYKGAVWREVFEELARPVYKGGGFYW